MAKKLRSTYLTDEINDQLDGWENQNKQYKASHLIEALCREFFGMERPLKDIVVDGRKIRHLFCQTADESTDPIEKKFWNDLWINYKESNNWGGISTKTWATDVRQNRGLQPIPPSQVTDFLQKRELENGL